MRIPSIMYKLQNTLLCLIIVFGIGAWSGSLSGAQQPNQSTNSFSQTLNVSTRDSIRKYADAIVTVIDGAAVISDIDLDRLSATHGVSWWVVVGNLMVAEEIANYAARGDYHSAVTTFAKYTTKEVLLNHQVLGGLSGALAVGELAGLPIKMQLSRLVKTMNKNAVECQRQLYFAARSKPVSLSHAQIIAESVKPNVIILYGQTGYLSKVEFHKCSALGTLSPLSNFSRDEVYAVFRMLYDAKLQAGQLNATKTSVAKELLNNSGGNKQASTSAGGGDSK